MADVDFYRAAVAEALRDLTEARQHLAEWESRVAKLTETINALQALIEPNASTESGEPLVYGALVESILKASNVPLTAIEIKARMDQRGYYWKKPANALISIHTTLKRWRDSGSVTAVPIPGESGKVGYIWGRGK